MRIKENVMIKIMRYFFGIRGVLDERNIKKVNQLALNAFVYLRLYVLLTSLVIPFLPDRLLNRSMFIMFAFANLVIGYGGVSLYVMHKISRLKLNYREVAAVEYPSAVRQAIIHGAWVGAVEGIVFYGVLGRINGWTSLVTIGFGILGLVMGWTTDTQREIGHTVKIKE